jgi:hypothetical protein
MIIAGCVLFVVGAWIFAWALCKAAANGNRILESSDVVSYNERLTR